VASTRHWPAALAFALATTVVAAQPAIKTWGDKPTPALATTALDGRPVDLKDLRGRVVLVNFWATWCEPCKDELPALVKLKDQLAGRPFELVTVNYGEFPDRINQYLARAGIKLPVLLDTQNEVSKQWKVGGLPMTFLVDAHGRVRYFVFGERAWNEGEPRELVEKLLSEVPRA
jgi:thiol-disulfide isomerase/thioredoxin